MPHYSDERKTLAVAAYHRFGLRSAERYLKTIWEEAPNRKTLIVWDEQGIVPSAEDEAKLTEVEQQRKSHIMAGFYGLMDDGFALAHRMAKEDKALGFQQAIFGLGIAKDKQFPEPRTGTAVTVGAAGQVNILVAASPNPPGAVQKAVPDDWVEGEVVSESSELVEGDEDA